MFLAIVFIVLGLFVLLNAMGIIVGANLWQFFWAVVLLAIGIRLLVKRDRCPMCGWHHFKKMHGKIDDDCCGCGHDHDHDKDGQDHH